MSLDWADRTEIIGCDPALRTFFKEFQTQARSHEPIFGDRTLIFGVNVIHWWGNENQNFGGDLMTLPFLGFFNC